MKFFLQQYTLSESICQEFFSTCMLKLHHAPLMKFLEIVVDISREISYIHVMFPKTEALKSSVFSRRTTTDSHPWHFI